MRDGGRAVLVPDRTFGGVGDRCIPEYADGSTRLLSVLYAESVTDRVTHVERHGDLVDSAVIVRVGPGVESEYDDYDVVRTFADPADLTGVGIAVTDWLAGLDDPGSAVACLDSLSTMVQYTDRKRTLKFLHAMASRFRSRGARLHCHVDPAAHDDATVAGLRGVFDDCRRLDGAPPGAERGPLTGDVGGDGSGPETRVSTDGGCRQ